MKKLKLKILLPLLLIVVFGGFAYKTTMKKKPVKMKVGGTVYVLPQDFLINLVDGQFAKVAVALVLAPGQSDGSSAAAAASSSGSGSQEVIGTLPEEAVVRSIITNTLTNETSTELLQQSSRDQLEQNILASIQKYTDLKVKQVLFPDLTVQ